MNNRERVKRGRKRHHKRSDSSLENSDESVQRGNSSHRHKSKRRRKYSSERKRSHERRESRNDIRKRAHSRKNRTKSEHPRRSAPVEKLRNNSHTGEISQRRPNSALPSTSNSGLAGASTIEVPASPAIAININIHNRCGTADSSTTRSHMQDRESAATAVTQTCASVSSPRDQASMNLRTNTTENSGRHSVKMNKNTLMEGQNIPKPAGPGRTTVEELLESELQCTICSELFIKATMLNCIHTFCKYCIEMWKRNKAECPLCRTPITTECRVITFDSLIERFTGTSEELKQQRLQILKDREELEARHSNEQRPSSASVIRNTEIDREEPSESDTDHEVYSGYFDIDDSDDIYNEDNYADSDENDGGNAYDDNDHNSDSSYNVDDHGYDNSSNNGGDAYDSDATDGSDNNHGSVSNHGSDSNGVANDVDSNDTGYVYTDNDGHSDTNDNSSHDENESTEDGSDGNDVNDGGDAYDNNDDSDDVDNDCGETDYNEGSGNSDDNLVDDAYDNAYSDNENNDCDGSHDDNNEYNDGNDDYNSYYDTNDNNTNDGYDDNNDTGSVDAYASNDEIDYDGYDDGGFDDYN